MPKKRIRKGLFGFNISDIGVSPYFNGFNNNPFYRLPPVQGNGSNSQTNGAPSSSLGYQNEFNSNLEQQKYTLNQRANDTLELKFNLLPEKLDPQLNIQEDWRKYDPREKSPKQSYLNVQNILDPSTSTSSLNLPQFEAYNSKNYLDRYNLSNFLPSDLQINNQDSSNSSILPPPIPQQLDTSLNYLDLYDPNTYLHNDFSDEVLPQAKRNKEHFNAMQTAAATAKSEPAWRAATDAASSILGDILTKENNGNDTESFSGKFSNSTFGKNFGAWSKGLDLANSAVTGILGEKNEYDGYRGAITRGMDSAYDAIESAAANFGPIGQFASLIMKGNKILSNVANKLGGGTDGMCVCAGTKVFTSTGKVVNIEDLQKEEGIIGWSEETKEIKPQAIHNFIEPRQKECVEIVLKNGYSIRCSIDHPILSDISPKAKSKYINGKRIAIREWKFRRADELKTGDFVGLANNIDYWGDNHLDNAYLVGLLIGDGSYGKGASCRIISADQDTWKYLEDNNLGIINHCDDSRPEKYNKEIRTYRIIGGMELLHQLGISYQTGKNKTLPKNIGTFDKSSVCNLLAGLFDTDGSISVNEEKKTYSITLYQSNIDLLEEVRIQLHKLGIFSTIGTRKAAKYELGGRIINSKESYRLEIHDISSALKFCNLIPLNISYKKENLNKIQNMLKDKRAQEHNDISGAKQCKIVSITYIGVQTVYNLQADYDHTYLANCIITHNTTTDAILGSAFLQMTPFGLINGFGGKKADTITKNDLAFEEVGSSYSGTNYAVDDALTKSGKKYGLFSNSWREKANREIALAKQQQDIMADIASDTADRLAIKNAMQSVNSNRRAFALNGGYDQASVRFGREGLAVKDILEEKKDLPEIKSDKVSILQELDYNNVTIGDSILKEVLPLNDFPLEEVYLEEVPIDVFKEGGKLDILEEVLFDSNEEQPIQENTVEDTVEDTVENTVEDTVEDSIKEPDYIQYAIERFPILATLEPVQLQYDPEFNPKKDIDEKRFGDIEYIPAKYDIIPYYYNYPKSEEYKGKSVIVFNDNVTNEDIALDWLTHGLREHDNNWEIILKNLLKNSTFKDYINDQLFGEFLLEKGITPDNFKKLSRSQQKKLNNDFNPTEVDKETFNSVVDATIRGILTNDRTTYAPIEEYEELINTPEWQSAYNYIFGINKFGKGGKFNVIPEGALHARLHHMENADNLTKKGIPVVSENENGELEQQAEIEKEEIIFRIEVTKKIEQLMDQYNSETSQKEKDLIAIETGKLLVDEILNNTIDNTNKLL